MLAMAACQTPPTRVQETQQREKPLELNEQTVVLDARSAFAFGLSRVENSRRLTWQDLTENGATQLTAKPLKDLHQVGMRLSLAGVNPQVPVIVVGEGVNGKGEEGHLAWLLLYFGLHDVQVASVEVFRKNWTRGYAPLAENVPQWKAVPRKELFTADVGDARVLDVSEKSDMPWKQFYTTDGRPDWKVNAKLSQKNILKTDHIVITSDDKSVSAARAAAFALVSLGFQNVRVLQR